MIWVKNKDNIMIYHHFSTYLHRGVLTFIVMVLLVMPLILSATKKNPSVQTVTIIVPIAHYSESTAYHAAKKQALLNYLKTQNLYIYETNNQTDNGQIKANLDAVTTNSTTDNGAAQKEQERTLSKEASFLIDILAKDRYTVKTWRIVKQKMRHSGFYATYIVHLNKKKISQFFDQHQDVVATLKGRMPSFDQPFPLPPTLAKKHDVTLPGLETSGSEISSSETSGDEASNSESKNSTTKDKTTTPPVAAAKRILIVPYIEEKQRLSDQGIRDFNTALLRVFREKPTAFQPVFMLLDLKDLLVLKHVMAFGFVDETELSKLQHRYQSDFIFFVQISDLYDHFGSESHIHTRIFGSDLWLLEEHEDTITEAIKKHHPSALSMPDDSDETPSIVATLGDENILSLDDITVKNAQQSPSYGRLNDYLPIARSVHTQLRLFYQNTREKDDIAGIFNDTKTNERSETNTNTNTNTTNNTKKSSVNDDNQALSPNDDVAADVKDRHAMPTASAPDVVSEEDQALHDIVSTLLEDSVDQNAPPKNTTPQNTQEELTTNDQQSALPNMDNAQSSNTQKTKKKMRLYRVMFFFDSMADYFAFGRDAVGVLDGMKSNQKYDFILVDLFNDRAGFNLSIDDRSKWEKAMAAKNYRIEPGEKGAIYIYLNRDDDGVGRPVHTDAQVAPNDTKEKVAP